MNSHCGWSKATTASGGSIARFGHRRVLQSFALCAVLAAAILILLIFPAPGHAKNHAPCSDGTPPPCNGGGNAITISLTQDMAFGTLAPDISLAGTAVINPTTGTKTVTGGVFDFGGIHTAAIFAVSGKKNTAFTITLPGAVTLTSGGNSMTLNGFTSDPAVGLLNNGGNANVTVGATLQVGANQPAGTYTGIFDVTVNY